MKKTLVIMLSLCICVIIIFAAAGCGSGSQGGSGAGAGGGAGDSDNSDAVQPAREAPVEEPKHKRTPVISARTLGDGRRVGGTAKGKIGDELTNVFFSYKVNKVEYADTFGELKPVRKHTFLIAEVTVKNAFDEPIPMWAEDFIIQWGDGDKDYGYPIPKSSQSQMEEAYNLDVDEAVTALVVYEVPVPEETREYSVSYLEYYEDKVEGNQFYVVFSL